MQRQTDEADAAPAAEKPIVANVEGERDERLALLRRHGDACGGRFNQVADADRRDQ